jgi:hypothetical protein
MYYSIPRLQVKANLEIDQQKHSLSGLAWYDHEFFTNILDRQQTGWDWFSLHVADGHRLMAYRLRDATGSGLTFGTWARPDGTSEALPAGAITMTPRRHADVAGRKIPIDWTLDVPSLGLTVDTEAVNPQSWMGGAFPYWEGPIRVSGSHEGRGYLEITLPSGEAAYTRDGGLKRSADGLIVTSEGFEVAPGITIPNDAVSVAINANGEVYGNFSNQIQPQILGQFNLVGFTNEKGLEAQGSNLFRESPASGPPIVSTPGLDGLGTLRQGYLEDSSVDAVREVSELIKAQRGYELNAKVITAADQMLSATTQVR